MKHQLIRLARTVAQHWSAECKNEKRFHVHYNYWRGKGWECAGEWNTATEADRLKKFWEKRTDTILLDANKALG
ncbi:hypothetical protein GCM10009715_42140 [Paeniglutamicibacter psychrophenolicus]|uniref:Uncharacterized protein n=1 Tax=Paeniglutamicibacter psychrophenolicus TaxID=257454 RepID=A0ABS4WJS0_9MICC|nr:hypothetical protein [Paeniglutamicibacter psychrophenolicus]MBP2376447.1 hypothetical protein [Paeniglutamicibacter psychrophenolicus]